MLLLSMSMFARHDEIEIKSYVNFFSFCVMLVSSSSGDEPLPLVQKVKKSRVNIIIESYLR